MYILIVVTAIFAVLAPQFADAVMSLTFVMVVFTIIGIVVTALTEIGYNVSIDRDGFKCGKFKEPEYQCDHRYTAIDRWEEKNKLHTQLICERCLNPVTVSRLKVKHVRNTKKT